MFTGIVEAIGRVKGIEKRGQGATLEIHAELPNNDIKVGDSLAVNGVCLTVTSRLGNTVWADMGFETLKVTTLGSLNPGDHVNLERAMQMGGRIGGHIVQGHTDGTGEIIEINRLDNGLKVTLEAERELSKYIVKRGSIGINGVSLTVTDAFDGRFGVFLIPHTIESTTFKYIRVGDRVNLEVDIIGKYVEKLTHIDSREYHEPSRITEEFLKRNGF